MNFKRDGESLVICNVKRSAVGQAGKSLSKMYSHEIANKVIADVIESSGIDKDKIDGVVSGEIGQSSKAPNVARVLAVQNEIPLDTPAITVANNCVSGYEAIIEASRRILLGENDVMLVTGQESMSNFPIYFDKAAQNSKTATSAKILKNWDSIKDDITVIDGVNEGLIDPVRDANMAETGEVAAQKVGLTKEDLDAYAHGSYSKALAAIEAGKYAPYITKIEHEKGVLEHDEFIMSKTSFVEKPERFAKAGAIFDMPPHTSIKGFYDKYGKWIGKDFKEGETKAAVTLFNACPRSDGAGALILTTESKAKELGLQIDAKIKSWGYAGVDPIYMGLGMAGAMKKALSNAELKYDDISSFEIHEAFAATALGSMHVVTKEQDYDLVGRLEKGDVNRNGGTLAMGHPLGATGIRVAVNQIIALKDQADSKYSMGTICAGGGVAGAIILEKA